MEIPDVTVYVLYDFDYQTKDGRHIEIKTGERLFLIKKTNNDWWQVIRSSERRPFYVPASYVEEVHKSISGSYKHENKKQNFPKPRTSLSSSPSEITSQQNSIKCTARDKFSDTASNLPSYRNRSFSLEDKRVIHNSSDKYSINSVGNNTLSSSGYESLCEAVSISDSNNIVIPLNRLQQEEVDYVNLRREGDGFVVDDETSNSETAQTQLKAADDNNIGSNCDDKAVLSGRTADNVNTQGAITGRLNSTKLEIVPSVTGGCYSNIIMCSDNIRKSGGFNGNSDLLLSSSLEELTEQIKVKTDKLRNVSNTGNSNNVICITDSSTIRQHHHDDSVNNLIIEGKSEAVSCESSCVNSIKKHSNIVSDVADRVKILNNKSEDSDTSSCKSDVDYKKLQYVGSFKTKQERQKWAKQHFEQCGLRNTVEAEKNKTEQSEQLDNICTLDMVNVENTDKIGGSSTMVGKVSTAVVVEKVRKVEESMQQMEAVQRKDIMEINKNKTSSRHSLDSIAEDERTDNKRKDEIKPLSSKSHQQQGSSDKGSLDSLLDIDRNSGRKISGGNTSDSLVPTDGEDLYMDNSDSETDSIVLGHSRLRSDAVDNREYKQKVLLMRNRRVDNKGRQYPMQAPPSPTTMQAPSRMLFNGWNEYLTDDNRKFFYNLETKEKSWKPPRRRYNSNSEKQANSGSIGNIYSDSSSPLAETDEILTNFQLPPGWRTQLDEDTGLPCYINIVTGAKWFSSSDSEGRLYFFEINSDESSWTLPITTPQIVNENAVNDGVPTDVIQTLSVAVPQSERVNSRPAKAKSMILADRREELAPLAPTVPRNWPQLWDGHMCVLKEGPLNRTKITENGKRLRKNWASTYVVLTELFLLFFKDSKTFTAMKSGGGRPELCVDLNGAVIDRGDKKSSRKNVYMISTVLELQVLIQCDCQSEAEQWLAAIESAIHNLPLAHDRCPRIPRVLRTDGGTSPEDNKKGSKILRVKSLKMKHKDESMEDLSVNPAERQTKIKERLKKFFHRRPTMESLVKKGIWKDEPVFGCYLEQVCGPEFPRVPLFVQRCIQCIERNVENMKTDGLYRASGNLSQVQKIRLQVDQNNYSVLEQEEDVHVLTSALKLFFRELKQPLIPFHLFSKALKASTNHNRKEKLKEFREIVKALPTPNHDTLKYLLQHLLQVTKYQGDKESNRMHIPNLAIVFGPTLMWPEQESLNMAFDMMQQNLVIECFLAEFDYIFR